MNMKKCAIAVTLICLLLFSTGCGLNAVGSEVVKYEGTKYVPLVYPASIFYYYYNGNSDDDFEEVDGIYPIDSPNWKMIWNGGDLYCDQKVASEAISYYANYENYDWFVTFDTDYDEEEFTPVLVEITAEEADAICVLNEMKKDTSATFEEFERLGSIYMVSKDGMVRATISIVKYGGSWYWNTETVDDENSLDGNWAEYIQPLPASVNGKVISVG